LSGVVGAGVAGGFTCTVGVFTGVVTAGVVTTGGIAGVVVTTGGFTGVGTTGVVTVGVGAVVTVGGTVGAGGTVGTETVTEGTLTVGMIPAAPPNGAAVPARIPPRHRLSAVAPRPNARAFMFVERSCHDDGS
jgi:hypothetical protein